MGSLGPCCLTLLSYAPLDIEISLLNLRDEHKCIKSEMLLNNQTCPCFGSKLLFRHDVHGKMLIEFLISFRMSEYAWISDRKDIIFGHEMVWGIGMQTSGILQVVYSFAQMILV